GPRHRAPHRPRRLPLHPQHRRGAARTHRGGDAPQQVRPAATRRRLQPRGHAVRVRPPRRGPPDSRLPEPPPRPHPPPLTRRTDRVRRPIRRLRLLPARPRRHVLHPAVHVRRDPPRRRDPHRRDRPPPSQHRHRLPRGQPPRTNGGTPVMTRSAVII